MSRERILDTAKSVVTGKREQEYGKVEDNFSTIAELWSAYLDTNVSALDVAMLMSLLKIARIRAGGTEDSFVDLAGYAACGGEIWENAKAESRPMRELSIPNI